MKDNSIYKTSRIKKLASQIRESECYGHDVKCKCPICEATFFVQRSMVFLEGALAAKEGQSGKAA
jgi:hypothetical protein